MRIAIVLGPFLPVPPVLGGAVEKVHLALARAYRGDGHEVTIVSRQYSDFAAQEIVDGIRHIRVGSRDRAASLPANLFAGLRYARRAAAVLPPADLTITNEFFLPLLLPRRAGKVYVQVGRYPKGQMFLYSRADRLQAVSQAVAAAIARQAPWLAARIAVIGYAVADAYFAEAPAAKPGKTVLYVGRLSREKGVDLLIRAFLRLRRSLGEDLAGWRLRIVGPHAVAAGGDGDAYLEHLKTIAMPLAGRCEFAGPIFDQQALAREYRASGIFVYPSRARFGESFGLAPLEAMACGCAAVVSGLRCFDDYLAPDETGLQFDHRGAGADERLAAQLLRLLVDPALLRRIAEAGHRAAGRFRTDAIAARMLADFRTLVAAGSGGPQARRRDQPAAAAVSSRKAR